MDAISAIKKVVDFDVISYRLLPVDFTEGNRELTNEILDNTDVFSEWVNHKLKAYGALYGIGGYNEHRTIYARSQHFNAGKESRRLHLGVDIWGAVGTPIYNFTMQPFKVLPLTITLAIMVQPSFWPMKLMILNLMCCMGI